MAAGRRILAVLRTSEEFHPRSAQAVSRQLVRWAPEAQFTCVSDTPIEGVSTLPLKYDWPDWWCKMALFDPAIPGGFLVTDLDNVFTGSLGDILNVTQYTNQRGDSNALAYYPEETRAAIWEAWMRDPVGHMARWDRYKTTIRGQFGDGGFIKSLLKAPQHWEDILPGQVVNVAWIMPQVKRPLSAMLSPWTPRERGPLRPQDLPKDMRVLLCARPHRPWKIPVLRRLGTYDF